MDDLIDFLKDFPHSVKNKTERQRKVRFQLPFRLEMASALAIPIMLLFGIPLSLMLAFTGQLSWIVPMLLTILVYFYGVFSLWPHIPARLGTQKVAMWTGAMLIALILVSWLVTGIWQVQYSLMVTFTGPLATLNLWPLDLLTVVLSLVTVYDADGLTPNLRSSFLARSWNRGKLKVMERWGVSYKLTPYGRISVKEELCTLCGTCVDVCPMLIPHLDHVLKTITLSGPENCVNCRACVYRCPADALYLEPETPAAREALRRLQSVGREES